MYAVRLMRLEDIPQVNEIDKEAYSDPWSPSKYKRDLLLSRFARYFVAWDDAEPSKPAEEATTQGGFLWRMRRLLSREEVAPSSNQHILGFAGMWFIVGEAHLTTIAVRETYRRRGIGELLLISAIELSIMRGWDMVTLEVREFNTPAQALYEKYGFKRVGVRRGYYTNNREDAILMSTENITSAPFQAHFRGLKEEHARRWGKTHLALGQ